MGRCGQHLAATILIASQQCRIEPTPKAVGIPGRPGHLRQVLRRIGRAQIQQPVEPGE
jgi:hypothetical protein